MLISLESSLCLDLSIRSFCVFLRLSHIYLPIQAANQEVGGILTKECKLTYITFYTLCNAAWLKSLTIKMDWYCTDYLYRFLLQASPGLAKLSVAQAWSKMICGWLPENAKTLEDVYSFSFQTQYIWQWCRFENPVTVYSRHHANLLVSKALQELVHQIIWLNLQNSKTPVPDAELFDILRKGEMMLILS